RQRQRSLSHIGDLIGALTAHPVAEVLPPEATDLAPGDAIAAKQPGSEMEEGRPVHERVVEIEERCARHSREPPSRLRILPFMIGGSGPASEHGGPSFACP